MPRSISTRLLWLASSCLAVAVLAMPSAAPAEALRSAAGYPQQNVLPVWPDNPNDASIAIGVTPYDEIAPKLNALQDASNRVSARVAGRSSGGCSVISGLPSAAA